MPDSKSTPLVEGAKNTLPLYDPASMLDLDVQMAQGFAILLTGAEAQVLEQSRNNKKGPSRQTVMLGFAALTDGNVIDATFGVRHAHGANVSEQGKQQIKNVKIALSNGQDSNDKVPLIAVTTYSQAFQVIAAFRKEVDEMNFITKCFKYGNVQTVALKALEKTFEPLQEALAEST